MLRGEEIQHIGAQTPLVAATQNGNLAIAKLFIETKSNLANETRVGRIHADGEENALMVASREGHIQVVQLILKHGVEVNQLLLNRGTGLMVAIREECLKIVELLLRNKASLEIPAQNGQYPLSLARELGKNQ